MKKIFFSLFLMIFASSNVLAAQPEGAYPPGTPADIQSPMPELDYISNKAIPLQPKELKALNLSSQWAKHDAPPSLAAGGKLIYIHGASLPTVLASPMQICDVELQQGEIVNEIVIGDSARWMVESGTVGTGSRATAHLFIKPVDAGLESSAVVTTDRRVYHLRLVSQRDNYTPYIGFSYASDIRRMNDARQVQEQKDKQWQSTTLENGQLTDLSALNFDYRVKGKSSLKWKPERVYDDGRQMFIRLPDAAITGEIPVLLVRKGDKDILVNYRVKDSSIVVDGIFDEIVLIIGVGGDQETVEIRRGA